MIYYTIDENNNVIGKEKVVLKTPQPARPGCVKIASTLDLENLNDWRWNGTEFVQKDSVPFTVEKYYQSIYDVNNMTFPNHCIVDVYGPGISQRFTTETLEFSSTRSGVYKFTLTARGYKKTSFEVTVK
jgi:hypothetical protein